MSLMKEDYMPRLVDDKVAKHLKLFGAVSIEGPKWCGKTWTGLNHSNSVSYMSEKNKQSLAEIDPKYIFTKERPQLIDEWQIVPEIWDAVRHECDLNHEKGKFILTGSTTLEKETHENRVHHSGTGRISSLKMYPMSLYESGDSTGDVSLSDLREGHIIDGFVRNIELHEIIRLIIRGGWPENLNTPAEDIGILPESYIESVIQKDIHERKDRKRDPRKMRMLLRSLSRNESTVVGDKTLVKDIEEYENGNELIASRSTVSDYLGVLNSLYITTNQEAFSVRYRSSSRIGKSAKRHLVDPSLCCACLGLTEKKLLNDHETLGFLFEALVERDLRIYAEYLEGHLYHFRDNASGDEIDAIIEFKDGEYAAFEIKLSVAGIADGLKSMKRFYDNVKKKPCCMCIVVGCLDAVMRDSDTGVYLVPLTSLKP